MMMAPITIDEIEWALDALARHMARPGGEVYAPLFERLENELAQRRRAESVMARAKARLAAAGDKRQDEARQ